MIVSTGLTVPLAVTLRATAPRSTATVAYEGPVGRPKVHHTAPAITTAAAPAAQNHPAPLLRRGLAAVEELGLGSAAANAMGEASMRVNFVKGEMADPRQLPPAAP